MQGSKNRNKCLSISMEQSLWNRWTTRLTLPDYEELEPWPGSMLLFYYVYLYILFFIYSSGVIANSLIILFIAAKKSRKMIVYHFILLELAIIDLVDHLLLVNFSKLFSTLKRVCLLVSTFLFLSALGIHIFKETFLPFDRYLIIWLESDIDTIIQLEFLVFFHYKIWMYLKSNAIDNAQLEQDTQTPSKRWLIWQYSYSS